MLGVEVCGCTVTQSEKVEVVWIPGGQWAPVLFFFFFMIQAYFWTSLVLSMRSLLIMIVSFLLTYQCFHLSLQRATMCQFLSSVCSKETARDPKKVLCPCGFAETKMFKYQYPLQGFSYCWTKLSKLHSGQNLCLFLLNYRAVNSPCSPHTHNTHKHNEFYRAFLNHALC